MEEEPSENNTMTQNDNESNANRSGTYNLSVNESNRSIEPNFDHVTLGPKRFVEINRSPNEPLGVSIVDYAIGIIIQSVKQGSAADLPWPGNSSSLIGTGNFSLFRKCNSSVIVLERSR